MLRKRDIAASLNALRYRIGAEALAHLQPILLLQILIAFSQSLNGGVIAQPKTLARTLLLDGQERLRKLQDAAPRLNLPVDRVLEICRSGDAKDAERTPEEHAVQALLEMCLGLVLKWLDESGHRPHIPVPSPRWQRVSPPDMPLFFSSLLLPWPPKARACPIFQLA